MKPNLPILYYRIGEIGKEVSLIVRELLDIETIDSPAETFVNVDLDLDPKDDDADLAVGMQVVREALIEIRKLRHVVGDERRAAIIAAYNKKSRS